MGTDAVWKGVVGPAQTVVRMRLRVGAGPLSDPETPGPTDDFHLESHSRLDQPSTLTRSGSGRGSPPSYEADEADKLFVQSRGQ